MTVRRASLGAAALALVLTGSSLSLLPATAMAAAPVAQAAAQTSAAEAPAPRTKPQSKPAAKASKPAAKAKAYRPRRGALFNNPLGGPKKKYVILDHIQAAIRHARRRSDIDIMSWNVMSRRSVDALIAAQRRGVRVRVLMDRSNRTELPNPSFNRLVSSLAKYNKRVKRPERRSYAKTCQGSCRGRGGNAHAKFFLFSQTGTARYVTMQGSANLTQAAASNQWNDIYTFVNQPKFYNFTKGVFAQMWRDRPVPKTFVETRTKNVRLYFSPLGGRGYPGDPYQQLLQKVRCKGAVNAGNAQRRTIVRVAPDVIRNERGMRAARQFKRMYNQGCDIKIGYTVMGKDIYRYLKRNTGRGPVPIRHLVQDFNGDGEFDNYFHLKSISINGVVGRNRTSHVIINGSANVSGFASVSDENASVMWGRGITRRYQSHIDYWYNNFPRSKPLQARYRGLPIDPYRTVDMD